MNEAQAGEAKGTHYDFDLIAVYIHMYLPICSLFLETKIKFYLLCSQNSCKEHHIATV